MANFGVFDDAAAKVFPGSLEHGASQVVTVDVKAGERLGKAAEWREERVKFWHGGRGLGIDEGGAPAVGVDEGDEVLFGLGFDARPDHTTVQISSLPADVVESRAGAE